MKLNKFLSTILVTVFVLMVTITPSLSQDKKYSLCFEEPVAKQLYIDKKFFEENYRIEQERSKALSAKANLLEEKTSTQQQKIDLLITDKDILIKQSDQYKELYLTTNKEKLELQMHKTSKSTWFAYGAVSTAVVIIASFFLVH